MSSRQDQPGDVMPAVEFMHKFKKQSYVLDLQVENTKTTFVLRTSYLLPCNKIVSMSRFIVASPKTIPS
jgi:hypothetical protein